MTTLSDQWSSFSKIMWQPVTAGSGMDGVYVYCMVPGVEPTDAFQVLSRLLVNAPGSGDSSGVGIRAVLKDNRLRHLTMTPPTLNYFLNANRHRRHVHLMNAHFSAEDCQTLVSSYQDNRHGFFRLWGCRLMGGGRSLFDAVANNKGPIELTIGDCSIFDFQRLLKATSVTSSLKMLYLMESMVSTLAS